MSNKGLCVLQEDVDTELNTYLVFSEPPLLWLLFLALNLSVCPDSPALAAVSLWTESHNADSSVE